MEKETEIKETKAEIKKRIKASKKLRLDVQEKTIGYIVASLGLVAGLAWNDAISTFIKYIFPLDGNTIIAKFVYAALISIMIVFLSQALLRVLAARKEDTED